MSEMRNELNRLSKLLGRLHALQGGAAGEPDAEEQLLCVEIAGLAGRLAEYLESHGLRFPDDLVVLPDPNFSPVDSRWNETAS